MTPKKLIREIAKREGLRKQVDIAQLTEIIGHLSDLMHELDPYAMSELVSQLQGLGEKRAAKREKELKKGSVK
jgi:hypothetical protein